MTWVYAATANDGKAFTVQELRDFVARLDNVADTAVVHAKVSMRGALRELRVDDE